MTRQKLRLIIDVCVHGVISAISLDCIEFNYNRDTEHIKVDKYAVSRAGFKVKSTYNKLIITE